MSLHDVYYVKILREKHTHLLLMMDASIGTSTCSNEVWSNHNEMDDMYKPLKYSMNRCLHFMEAYSVWFRNSNETTQNLIFYENKILQSCKL